MTLEQAFTEWASIPENTAQTARNRSAVDSILLKKYGKSDVREFTAFRVRKIMDDLHPLTERAKGMKIRTASILVQLLTYAAGKGACLKPEFDYTIASSTKDDRTDSSTATNTDSPTKDPSPKKRVQQERPSEASQEVLGQESSEGTTAPEPPLRGKNRTNGRPKIPVVQVDPKNGKIVAKFDSKVEASLSVGANRSSVATAIDRGHLCKGYYWFTADTKISKIKMFVAGKLAKSGRRVIKKNKGSRILVNSETVGSPGSPPDKSVLERGGVMSQTTNATTSERTPLSFYSDQDLRAELERRGWYGTLYQRLEFMANRQQVKI